MKTFFKQVLAVVVGMLIVSAFTFLMGFIMLGAMLSAGDSKPVIKNGSVLRIDLSGNLQERVQENPVSVFLGMSGTEEQGLDNILKSIKIRVIMATEQDHVLRPSGNRTPDIICRHIFLYYGFCVKLYRDPRCLL